MSSTTTSDLFSTKNKSEVTEVQNYRKSDYAINKNSPNIVYRFHNEIIEITLEDYLKENPDKRNMTLQSWKPCPIKFTMSRIGQRAPRPARMFRSTVWRKRSIVPLALWMKNGKNELLTYRTASMPGKPWSSFLQWALWPRFRNGDSGFMFFRDSLPGRSVAWKGQAIKPLPSP